MYENKFRKTMMVIYKEALSETTKEKRIIGFTDFIDFLTEELRRRRALRDIKLCN